MKSNKKQGMFGLMFRSIGMVLRLSPKDTVKLMLVATLQTAFMCLTPLTLQFMFESLGISASQGVFSAQVAISIALFGIVYSGVNIINGIMNLMLDNYLNICIGKLNMRIAGKSARIEPTRFEAPSLMDTIGKAGQGAMMITFFALMPIIAMFIYLPYFLVMGAYFFSLKPILALSIVIIFIPLLLTQLVRAKLFSRFADNAAPLRRQFEYYEKAIADREFFKETRLLGSYRFFKGLYIDAVRLLNKEQWRAESRSAFAELGMKVLTLAGYLGVIYMLFTSLLGGDISVGAFAAVYASMDTVFSLMDELVCRHFGEASRNVGAVRGFLDFLDIEERGGRDAKIDANAGICLENVSFRYPEAEFDSIRNISLEIKPQETIAIVGANGAGKTTLIRLLTGVYLPNNGHAKIGGTEIKDISPGSIFAGVSSVFQKYQRYKMTLSDNVFISDAERGEDAHGMEDALDRADLDVGGESFPNGAGTMLSREFDGVDLSGGQWQRVAIARGFYKRHGLIALDEPTAAIDPIEETRVFNRFTQMAKGKTAVIATHRLGSARVADRIVVLDGGRIDSVGSHDELMAQDGLYRRMYDSQAQWYTEASR